MRKLLKKYGFIPDKLVTDDLRSYAAAAGHLGIVKRRERGRWRNSRAENSHQPTRRRDCKMQGFKSPGSAQKFLSTHAAAYNTFNVQRHLTSAKTHRAFRATAMRRGATSSLRREPNVPADLLCALFGNVTVPPRAMRGCLRGPRRGFPRATKRAWRNRRGYYQAQVGDWCCGRHHPLARRLSPGAGICKHVRPRKQQKLHHRIVAW